MNDPKYKEMFGNMFRMQSGKEQPRMKRFEYKVIPGNGKGSQVVPGKPRGMQIPKMSPEMMERMKKMMERSKSFLKIA